MLLKNIILSFTSIGLIFIHFFAAPAQGSLLWLVCIGIALVLLFITLVDWVLRKAEITIDFDAKIKI